MARHKEPRSKKPRKHPDRGHDGDEGKKKKKKPPTQGSPPSQPTVTEQLKEASTQSGPAALDATPTTMPSASSPDASPAIYSTGPGQVVVYGYDRQGQGSEEYALQQSAYTAPVPASAGVGQILTPAAAGGQ